MTSVLYIDDDRIGRQLVCRILARRPDLEVLTAGDGSEGLELAANHRPDLVLSDLRLPDLSGLEILAALRSHPELRHVPVVIVSGDAAPERVQELLSAGASDYLTKPFSFTQLLAVVERHAAPPDGTGHPRPERDEDRVAGPVTSSPLSPDLLARLHRLHSSLREGDPLVADFVRDAQELVDRVHAGLLGGDLDDAATAAHNLKGGAAMFAAESVSVIAGHIERQIATDELPAARALLGVLKSEMQRAGDALLREFPPT